MCFFLYANHRPLGYRQKETAQGIWTIAKLDRFNVVVSCLPISSRGCVVAKGVCVYE